MPMPDLPAELIDYTLDFLHDDKPQLATCSRVCRSWIPCCRYHLFRIASINASNAKGFIEILQSPSSTVGPYVHDLTLDAGHHSWLNEMAPCLTPLVTVKILRLHDICWQCPGYEARTALLSTFRNIVEFHVFHSSYGDVPWFLDATAGFRLLKHLSVHYLRDYGDTFYSEWRAPPSLESLSWVDSYGLSNILSRIISSQPIPKIQSLDLHGIRMKELLLVQRLLLVIAPSLHHLSMTFKLTSYDEDSHLEIRRHIDLSCLPDLRSVSLQMQYLLFLSGIPYTNISFLLSQIVSHHMDAITLYCRKLDHLELFDWSELVDTLMRPQFLHLQRIYFRLQLEPTTTPIARQVYETQFRSLLRPLESRGILFFTLVEPGF